MIKKDLFFKMNGRFLSHSVKAIKIESKQHVYTRAVYYF